MRKKPRIVQNISTKAKVIAETTPEEGKIQGDGMPSIMLPTVDPPTVKMKRIAYKRTQLTG